MTEFILGIKELDKLYSRAFSPGSLMVIAGHPGAGKTTFAITVCYNNSLRGYRCLYITLQEDKDKLYKNMKRLGMDLEVIEQKGLFNYVKLPITLSIEDIVREIGKLIHEGKYKVIIIDSINSLMQGIKNDELKRAWLQNFFYELPRLVNGLLILVAELPFGEEKLGLGAIEFVADGIFILKHKVERGLLMRTLEIRKLRGSPIYVAEIPFTIREEKGLEVYTPPILEKLPREGKELQLPFKTLRKAIDHIHKGNIVFITYPPDAKSRILSSIFAGIVLANKLKTLIISHSYNPRLLRELIKYSLKDIGLSETSAESIVNKLLVVRALNPFSYSISQLLAREQHIINSYSDIDVVVFHGAELLPYVHMESYLPQLYNQLNYLKSRNVLITIFGAFIDNRWYNINASLSDVVIRLESVYSEQGFAKNKLIIWRRWNSAPYVMPQEEIDELLQEIKEFVKSRIMGDIFG